MRIALSSLLLATAAIQLTTVVASAAVLQVSVQNLAPVDSLALDFSFQLPAGQNIENIAIMTTAGGMEVLPQFGLQLGVGSTGGSFPAFPGGFTLGTLNPGERLSFTITGVELLGGSSLHFGGTLFSALPVSNAAGDFLAIDTIVSAAGVGEFSMDAMPLLILPESNTPGPASITPTTALVRFTVVPEPTSLGLLGVVAALGLRRRRSSVR
jgi:hypothetical protein